MSSVNFESLHTTISCWFSAALQVMRHSMPTSFTITYVCIVDLLWRTHGSLPANCMIASTHHTMDACSAQVGSQKKMARSCRSFSAGETSRRRHSHRCPELRPIRCIFGCPWLPMETTNYTGKFRHLRGLAFPYHIIEQSSYMTPAIFHFPIRSKSVKRARNASR